MRARIQQLMDFTTFSDGGELPRLCCRVGKNPWINGRDPHRARDLMTLQRCGVIESIVQQGPRDVIVKLPENGPIRFGRVTDPVAYLRVGVGIDDSWDDAAWLFWLGLNYTAQVVPVRDAKGNIVKGKFTHYGIISGRDGGWRFGLSAKQTARIMRQLKAAGLVEDAAPTRTGKRRLHLVTAADPDRFLFDTPLFMVRKKQDHGDHSAGSWSGSEPIMVTNQGYHGDMSSDPKTLTYEGLTNLTEEERVHLWSLLRKCEGTLTATGGHSPSKNARTEDKGINRECTEGEFTETGMQGKEIKKCQAAAPASPGPQPPDISLSSFPATEGSYGAGLPTRDSLNPADHLRCLLSQGRPSVKDSVMTFREFPPDFVDALAKIKTACQFGDSETDYHNTPEEAYNAANLFLKQWWDFLGLTFASASSSVFGEVLALNNACNHALFPGADVKQPSALLYWLCRQHSIALPLITEDPNFESPYDTVPGQPLVWMVNCLLRDLKYFRNGRYSRGGKFLPSVRSQIYAPTRPPDNTRYDGPREYLRIAIVFAMKAGPFFGHPALTEEQADALLAALNKPGTVAGHLEAMLRGDTRQAALLKQPEYASKLVELNREYAALDPGDVGKLAGPLTLPALKHMRLAPGDPVLDADDTAKTYASLAGEDYGAVVEEFYPGFIGICQQHLELRETQASIEVSVEMYRRLLDTYPTYENFQSCAALETLWVADARAILAREMVVGDLADMSMVLPNTHQTPCVAGMLESEHSRMVVQHLFPDADAIRVLEAFVADLRAFRKAKNEDYKRKKQRSTEDHA